MALRDYLCSGCGRLWEEFIRNSDDEPTKCIYCESLKIEKLPSVHGGYHISGANGSSVRPKSSGSFKRTKS